MTCQLREEIYFFWVVFFFVFLVIMTVQCLVQFMSKAVKIPCTVVMLEVELPLKIINMQNLFGDKRLYSYFPEVGLTAQKCVIICLVI